jgi:hypothetical protein
MRLQYPKWEKFIYCFGLFLALGYSILFWGIFIYAFFSDGQVIFDVNHFGEGTFEYFCIMPISVGLVISAVYMGFHHAP